MRGTCGKSACEDGKDVRGIKTMVMVLGLVLVDSFFYVCVRVLVFRNVRVLVFRNEVGVRYGALLIFDVVFDVNCVVAVSFKRVM